jgi:hypothetical protein
LVESRNALAGQALRGSTSPPYLLYLAARSGQREVLPDELDYEAKMTKGTSRGFHIHRLGATPLLFSPAACSGRSDEGSIEVTALPLTAADVSAGSAGSLTSTTARLLERWR